ncbi:MAG: hypothetical protein OEW72_09550 [Gammaproteobacteria bacterium]|nr:hypothetical protein [Gammaproteobacteria bacterium]
MAAPVAALIALLALLGAPAEAVELALEGVTAGTPAGEVQLRVTSRATFSFDPEAGTLVSAGTWVAEYLLPNQATRFAHQVEDFSASAVGTFAVRSYQCVEGTFAARFLAASLCGNYRFGPNGIDEGGVADDVVLGPPRSLGGYRLSKFDWDGAVLVVDLSADTAGGSELFPESGLRLRLVVKPRG